MNNSKIENFFDDMEISSEAKEFWVHIAYKLSTEEIEAFIILKKQNPEDLVKAINILMRREKVLLEKDAQKLKEILDEEKNMFEG